MDDSKRGLNLVSTSVANIKNDLLGLANVLEHQVLPKINKMASGLQQARLLGPTGQPISSANSVAFNGAPSAPADNSGSGAGGGGVIANSGVGGGGLGRAAGIANGVLAFGNFVSNAMPSAATAVRQDLLTSQSAFYGQGGFAGSLQQRSAAVRSMQVAMARTGIATNAMDTTNALATAQSMGLTGATNFNQVMQGAATASAFAPGIGVTGAVQAAGTMNAPGTVNMLRTIGINVRSADGSVKPLPQVVDQIWNFITGNGRDALSAQDIQVGLMPGNGLYGMLTSLFGQDQMTLTLVSNMLIAKAKTGGKTALGNMSKGQLQQLGLTTATVNKMANQTAGQTNLLTTTASSIAAGYGASADLGAAMNNFAAAAGPLTQALGAFSGGYTGTMGLGNGTMGTLIKSGAAALGGAAVGGIPGALVGLFTSLFLGREQGGPVDNKTPYVVGEKGPELFVPKSDGVIVPNGIFREAGGGVKAGGSSGALSDSQLKSILSSAGFSGSSLSTAMDVVRAESGGRAGALNPNASTGDYSMGLFQINMIGELGKQRNANYLKKYGSIGYTGPQSLYNPAINAAIAYDISKGGTNWSDAWVNTSKKLGLGGGGVASSSGGGSGSGTGTGLSTLSSLAPTASYAMQIQNLLSSASGATNMAGVGGGITYNNGPLTINISGTTDPKKVATEVQKILAANNIISQTGSH